MDELEFDDLLLQYLDKDGKIYDGIVEIDLNTGKATKSKTKRKPRNKKIKE